MYEIPILLVCFNRPAETQKVFSAIRKRKPAQLFVAIDGPRDGQPTDKSDIENVDAVVSKVDWDCEVFMRRRPQNLGCKRAVSDAITWFFSHVDAGIILEDDTVPVESFFDFMRFGLRAFEADDRVFMISGHNPNEDLTKSGPDYFFSKIGSIWGWGTWRRAWSLYDVEMTNFENQTSLGALKSMFGDINGLSRYNTLRKAFTGEVDTWDYQWSFTRHLNWGLSCLPSVNLVSNIGFGPSATHTQSGSQVFATNELYPPYSGPDYIAPHWEFDQQLLKRRTVGDRIQSKIFDWVNGEKR